MAIARVQLPDGRVARFEVPEGTSPQAIEAMAAKMVGTGSSGLDPERPYEFTLPLGFRFKVGGPIASAARAIGNVDDKTSTTVALGTMGSLAAGPAMLPSILGSAAGGAAGGALAESNQAGATPGSIARAGAMGGASMAAAELGGHALGAAANRLIAPNIRYADPMAPVRQRIASSGFPEYVRRTLPLLKKWLPEGGAAGAAVQRAGKFAASPMGGELLEATVVPAATAAFGLGVGAPLYLARAAFAPGVLQRYLANSRLPNAAVRVAGRQAATTALRGASQESAEEYNERNRRRWKSPE